MKTKKGSGWIEYTNYVRHYIEDTPTGHKITLVSADDSTLEINCVWSDRSRDKAGRVTLAKK